MAKNNSKKIIKITGNCWSCGEPVIDSGKCPHCSVFFRADGSSFLIQNKFHKGKLSSDLGNLSESRQKPSANDLGNPTTKKKENFENEESRLKPSQAVFQEKIEAVSKPSQDGEENIKKNSEENRASEQARGYRSQGIFKRFFDSWINI